MLSHYTLIKQTAQSFVFSKLILFLSKVFTKVECNCNDDNETLYDEGVSWVYTEELQTDLQSFKYQYADQYAADTTNTTVGGYAADSTSCDSFQLITKTGCCGSTTCFCAQQEACLLYTS